MAHFAQQNQENEQVLNSIFAENTNQIAESLGGLSNIIQLCLSNPDASKYINKDKFDSFKVIMSQNGISWDSKLDQRSNIRQESMLNQHDRNVESPTSTTTLDMSSRTNQFDYNNICNNEYTKDTHQSNYNSTNTKHNQDQWITNIANLQEYMRSRLIINVKTKNKIVFQWFGTAGHIAKSITSKTVWYLLILSIVFGFIIATIFLILYGSNALYFTTLTITFCISAITVIILLLNADKLIYSLILNTFDFWFILWNIINVVIAKLFLGLFNGPFIWYSIMRSVAVCCAGMVLACFDAIHVSKRFKVISRIIVVMYFVFFIVWFYFSGKDAQWNPFESYGIKESNISFKSIYLSSLTNVALFSFKPLLKDIHRFFCKHIYSSKILCGSDTNIIDTIAMDSHNGANIHYPNRQKCVSLYTRPYVQWQETPDN